jgi:hypothetical protein
MSGHRTAPGIGESLMRARRISAAVLLAGSVVALAAPGALADSGTGSNITSFGFSVTPSTVAPGGRVTLRATDCAAQATASAPALFDDVTLGKGTGSGQSATVQVGTDAKPGAQYDVTFTCGPEKGTTPLTISDGSPTPSPTAPIGAVKTGLGGGISGPNSIEIVAGVALVGAAGVYVVRRRSARH